MIDFEQLARIACDSGAEKAKVLPCSEIVFETELRKYCTAQYCDTFGKNYGCPPLVGTPDELIMRAREYDNALVFQVEVKTDDIMKSGEISRTKAVHFAVCCDVFKAVKPIVGDSIQLSAGGCALCKRCAAADGMPCIMPHSAIASVSSYCINVQKLALACAMEYKPECAIAYFGIVLFGKKLLSK